MRSLMFTLLRSLAAVAAMAGALLAFGTAESELALGELALGGAAGVATYIAVLIAIKELRLHELRALARIAQAKLSRG